MAECRVDLFFRSSDFSVARPEFSIQSSAFSLANSCLPLGRAELFFGSSDFSLGSSEFFFRILGLPMCQHQIQLPRPNKTNRNPILDRIEPQRRVDHPEAGGAVRFEEAAGSSRESRADDLRGFDLDRDRSDPSCCSGRSARRRAGCSCDSGSRTTSSRCRRHFSPSLRTPAGCSGPAHSGPSCYRCPAPAPPPWAAGHPRSQRRRTARPTPNPTHAIAA